MKANNIDNILREVMLCEDMPSPELYTKIRYSTINDRPVVKSYYRSRRIIAIAAVIGTLITLSAVSLATNLFGLRNMELPTPEPGDQFLGIPITDEMFDDPEYSWLLNQDFSMQGFEGSPEHSAAVEWRDFLYSYDVDGKLSEAAGNSWGDAPEQYRYYGAYTMEMVEKIREITEKHGLILIGDWLNETVEEFNEIALHGSLFTDESVWYHANIYDSGTIRLEGEFNDISFYMRSSRKGVFDWVSMGVNELSSYTEWLYVNAFGVQTLLNHSADHSLIIIDTETAFNVISIHFGTHGSPFTELDLEEFADKVDIGQIKSEAPNLELVAVFEAKRNEMIEANRKRNEMIEAVSFLFGEWQLLSLENDSALLPMWNSEYIVSFLIDDQFFRLWHVDSFDESNSWFIDGEITPDDGNGFKAVAQRIINNPFSNVLSNHDALEMQMQYDSDRGHLRLLVGENGSSMVFVRTQ